MSDVNSGPGWYEVIHPAAATTEIVRVMEDGSIYCPEGVITRGEFLYAAARGKAHRLVRADDPEVRAAVVAEEPEGRRQFTAAYRARNNNVISLETPNMLREAAEKTVREFAEEDPEGPHYFVATRILSPWVPVKQEGADQ